MSTIANASAPTVVSFEVLLAKMEPHFKFFAKRVLKLKADNLDDALQEGKCVVSLLSFVPKSRDNSLWQTSAILVCFGGSICR